MAEIVPVANTNEPSRTADVVFLHGLDGDARVTWGAKRRGADFDLDAFWPRWLGEDIPEVGYGRSSTTLRFQSGRGPVCPSATGRPACSIF